MLLLGLSTVEGAPLNTQGSIDNSKLNLTKPKSNNSISSFQTNDEISFDVAGGLFMPFNDIDAILDPTWTVRVSIQNNQLRGTRLGMGIDLSYAYPPDKEIDGGLMFISAIPVVTSTFPLFNVMDVQLKPGLGLTVINSVVRKNNSLSADLTLQFGIGIQRLFFKHLVVGLDASYLHYFERNSFSAYTVNFALGYRFGN